ncbi:MAG TPA: FAD-dependent oxidoreductase [Thermoanaerobaculia bacterium]|nr:FAD-dependent oxidoreductase [Thermoanaerobaculia bacterium]
MRVAVVGAGVSGLTCAVVLADAGFRVTVIADDFEPRASAAAAAIWFPYAIGPIADAMRWAHHSYDRFRELASVAETGVSFIDFRVLSEKEVSEPPDWAERYGAAKLPGSDCGPYRSGFRINVPLIDTRRYLPWLRAQLERRTDRIETTIRSLSDLIGYDVIVNCSGHRAATLHGRGPAIDPRRGIVLRLPNPGISHASVFEEDAGRLMYVVPRGDDVVLGGTYEPTGDEQNLPEDIATTILDRCSRIEPRLAGIDSGKVLIAAGIRPVAAEVCLRLERGDGPSPVIHNYGHGGSGFTVSWGCAADVLKLVRQASAD